MKYKLLFTGAHHNSALATLDWLEEHGSEYDAEFEFSWIGKKHVHNKKAAIYTPEYHEVTKRNIKFYEINTGKLYRFRSIAYVPHFLYNHLLIPVGFVKAFTTLLKAEPDMIVSFGGYVAVPVVIAGWLLGIPSVTHEQTTVIGLANKIIERFVSKIFVSWPESYYPDADQAKLSYVGLPMRKNLLEMEKYSERYEFDNKMPSVYITGGKSGSLFINRLIIKVLPELLKVVNVIWSCGHRKGPADYTEIAMKIDSLNAASEDREFRSASSAASCSRHKSGSSNIVLKEYFHEDEIAKVYKTCDFVITRSGAHTVYELGLLKKPCLLIPIPWSSNNEQYKNAQVLESTGLGVILDEEKLTPDMLINEVHKMLANLSANDGAAFKNPLGTPQDKQSKIKNNGEKNLGVQVIDIARQKKKTA